MNSKRSGNRCSVTNDTSVTLQVADLGTWLEYLWDDEGDQREVGEILKHCMMAVHPMKTLKVHDDCTATGRITWHLSARRSCRNLDATPRIS